MICALPGCGCELTPKQITDGSRFHTPQCSQIDRSTRCRMRPALTLLKPQKPHPDSEYMMRCVACDKQYDGREGPWIGLCSVLCVGAHAMGEAADSRQKSETRDSA